jgi:putative transposase
MVIKKAFKFRIYPTSAQQAALAIQFGHARFVYNMALAARKTHYEEYGQGLNYNDTAYMLTVIKPFVPWLKEADSQVLQQSLKNLDRAYVNFFEGRADYPKFKKKFDAQSIRYPQRFEVSGNRIKLPKVGEVRAVFHRPIVGQMKNCTVSKTKSGKYFISIQCEVEIDDPQLRSGEVGVDLGLKDFVTLSTGEKIKPPQYLRNSERRLKIRQRRLSRKQKGSNNRGKARLRVAIQHERVANQRKDFHHQLSHSLVERFGFIAFEDLNVNGMLKNHHLAKSIQDAGWSQFVGFCEYKANWTGGRIEKRDRFFPSSKLCSVCGEINHQLKLSDREWLCLGCGTVHDRDENAAINILNGHTAGVAEIYACGDMSLVGDSAQEAQAF